MNNLLLNVDESAWNMNPVQQQISYMPVKLKKKFSSSKSKPKTLKKCQGLEPVLPEVAFQENVLTQMFTTDDSLSKCDFLIVVAMYNESSVHFTDTMQGISENLSQFSENDVDLNRIACVVIVDGMKPFLEIYHREVTFFAQFTDLNAIENFSQINSQYRNLVPNNSDDEFAHCFIQKYRFGVSQHSLNFVFCIKEQNKRKLNTHLWFFGGFCEMVKPKYVMLLDVGTKPLNGSLYHLYNAMERDPQIGGCCGEIKPNDYNIWKIVIPAQVVEYKFSHMLDKALESVIGYITVLPGAFSAYRWQALEGGPLWKDYFKSICRPDLMNAFMSNIYLAEDRVLCLSLVSKKNNKYLLRYVKASVAETDVPSTLSELMAQRRRWNNGSMFALIDAVWNCKKIFKSSHHCYRKCLFLMQMIYYSLNILYSWFIVGAFCLTLAISIRKNNEGSTNSYTVGSALLIMYVTILLVLLATSMAVKPKVIEDFYKIIALLLGSYQIYTFYLIVKFMATRDFDHNAEQVIFVLLGIAISFALIVIINCEVWTILKGTFHYIIMIPTYVNVFLIYSICNTHDCTWGNRPDQLTKEELDRLEDFQEFRTKCTIFWVICNSGFVYCMSYVEDSDSIYSFYFISGVAATGVSILIIRVLGGIIYLFVEHVKTRKSFRKTKRISLGTSELSDLNRSRTTDLNYRKSHRVTPSIGTIKASTEKQDESFENSENALIKKNSSKSNAKLEPLFNPPKVKDTRMIIEERNAESNFYENQSENGKGIEMGEGLNRNETRVFLNEENKEMSKDYNLGEKAEKKRKHKRRFKKKKTLENAENPEKSESEKKVHKKKSHKRKHNEMKTEALPILGIAIPINPEIALKDAETIVEKDKKTDRMSL